MMHHFGVLVPPTNTTAEDDYERLLPQTLKAHVGRIPLLRPGQDETELETQAQALGCVGIEAIGLMQTTASLDVDDFDKIIARRMCDAAGVPAVAASQAFGQSVHALGARRVALLAPVELPVLGREKHHYEHNYGLDVVALERFSADNGADAIFDAMARIDRPGIEVMLIRGGGSVPMFEFVPAWERALGKPIVTPSQALLWAMLRIMKIDGGLPGLGRLLEDMPQR